MKYVLYLAGSNGDLCTAVQQDSGTANPQTTVSCRDCIFLPVYFSRYKLSREKKITAALDFEKLSILFSI